MECPNCQNPARKNGFTKSGSQRFRCDHCKKSFAISNDPLGVLRLPMDEAIKVLHCLLEGNSIRSTERMIGVNRNTIMALLVHVGSNCRRMMEAKFKHVCVNDVQCDEIWSFVGCKEKHRQKMRLGESVGDAYTFIGIERDTKLVMAWHLGKRSPRDTKIFAEKLAVATSGHFQLTTDGWLPYRTAMPAALGERIDFMTLVKVYGHETKADERRYSPPVVTKIIFDTIIGEPIEARACTSHIERQNLSIRMGTRRFTRLTNAFSKKWENHDCALALWFAFYNFGRKHMTLKETPAMASGLENHVWTIRELIEESAKF